MHGEPAVGRSPRRPWGGEGGGGHSSGPGFIPKEGAGAGGLSGGDTAGLRLRKCGGAWAEGVGRSRCGATVRPSGLEVMLNVGVLKRRGRSRGIWRRRQQACRGVGVRASVSHPGEDQAKAGGGAMDLWDTAHKVNSKCVPSADTHTGRREKHVTCRHGGGIG